MRFSFSKRRETSSTDAENHGEDIALEARVSAESIARDGCADVTGGVLSRSNAVSTAPWASE